MRYTFSKLFSNSEIDLTMSKVKEKYRLIEIEVSHLRLLVCTREHRARTRGYYN